MLPHDGKRKNVMQQLHSHVLSCPNFDGGFKIPSSRPPLSFEKMENGGCVKVAHF